MSDTTELQIEGLTLTIPVGAKFTEICDRYDTPLLLGCRACSCGTCLVEVIQGMKNLSLPTESEIVLLSILAEDNPQARLACQCAVFGSVALRLLST